MSEDTTKVTIKQGWYQCDQEGMEEGVLLNWDEVYSLSAADLYALIEKTCMDDNYYTVVRWKDGSHSIINTSEKRFTITMANGKLCHHNGD
jgi:hypothetical protein